METAAKTTAHIRCGCCLGRHTTTTEVRDCYAERDEMQAQMDAEIAAEAAVERHLEDRGYWDARAQEDYERRCGVIDFADAYRAACPWLFDDED